MTVFTLNWWRIWLYWGFKRKNKYLACDEFNKTAPRLFKEKSRVKRMIAFSGIYRIALSTT